MRSLLWGFLCSILLAIPALLASLVAAIRAWAQLWAPIRRSALDGPQYRGSWAVVVGSSSGIGLEYARVLAEAGMHVVVTSRQLGRAEDAAALIQRQFPRVRGVGVAICMESPAQATEQLRQAMTGRDVSICVLSASVESLTPLEDDEKATHTHFESMRTHKFECGVLQELQNMLTANCVSYSLLARACVVKLTQRAPQPACLLGCSAISRFVRIEAAEAYCASRDFQSALFSQLQV